MMKGEFAVVDYVGYESTYSDILALDNVRHRNTKYAQSFHVEFNSHRALSTVHIHGRKTF